MSTLKVALLQLFSFSYDQEANQAKGAQFCCQARQGGADIALFPEMWNIGYQLPDPSQPAQVELWQRHAIDRQSAFVSSFRKLACDLDMAIGLTYLEKWDGAPRNSLSLIDRHGDICLTYAKMHTCGWHAFLKVAKGLKKKAIFGKFGVSAPNQNRGRPTWSLTQTLPPQTLPNSQGRR
jgi:N-carbamoylputrescine amidase